MKQRILAVDDEIHMLRLLERIISEKTPYQITTTNNSLEVPEILGKDHFDLIITDLKMPGMDGIDILRMVREKGRPEEVIIITAFGSLETAIEALSRGVFDYITKPFKKEQIIFTVDRAMRWQNLKREAARMSEIFSREPYEKARRAFELEYVRLLAERCGGSESAMAERSGLPPDFINAAMKENEEKP
ncbi:response regulator [Candidatus Poribacteria bacterium]|nr:response regulator [Candidatus Poribacteria bacterium]